MMNHGDTVLVNGINPGWLAVGPLTISEAAFLLCQLDPKRINYYTDRELYPVGLMRNAIARAIAAGNLPYVAAWKAGPRIFDPDEPVENVTAHTELTDRTTVRLCDLVAWCELKDISHPFPPSSREAPPSPQPLANYPDELRAAIDAFEAVSREPALTAKQTPKAALAAWLAKHKPELSGHARDRIATVANWLPRGGAPKTPGE